MILETLSLINYKNFDQKTFNFDSKINCIVGNNGVGKTNVLDAIYHLSFGKSYFNPVATQNIKHNQSFFVINGVYNKHETTETIVVSLKKGKKKVIKRNDKPYTKFSEHIGLLPLVIISPADRNLIIEGSDTRRKFIDTVISLNDKTYLKHVIGYNKVLSQRNALLKSFALNNTFNTSTLEAFNHQLELYGQPIFDARNTFIKVFTPIFKKHYKAISNSNETVDLVYKSDLFGTSISTLLELYLKKDKILQFTSAGIHKDDLQFAINGFPIKKFGSQGQQKSYLIALKLAQFDFIKETSKDTPILLLDDIFDKLDQTRVQQIITLVNKNTFGQLFISDTHKQRTEAVVKQVHQDYKMFEL